MSTNYYISREPWDETTEFARRSNGKVIILYTEREFRDFKLNSQIIWGDDGSQYNSIEEFKSAQEPRYKVEYYTAASLNNLARETEQLAKTYRDRGGEWTALADPLEDKIAELRARAKHATKDGMSVVEFAEYLKARKMI